MTAFEFDSIHFCVVATKISVTYCYSDWDSNCLGCECKWSSGKKVANCTNAKLNGIPQDLHSEVQVLILDYNFISQLGESIFIRNLPNLQKISLRNCGIKTINEKAFNGLKILVEVDLSYNNITKVIAFLTFFPALDCEQNKYILTY